MPSTGLRIEVLGGFRVSVAGHPVPDDVWHRRKPAALLKLLALAPGHRLHREQLMDGLWPELGRRRRARTCARRSTTPELH